MDTIGRPDDTWQSETSTQHLKTATREFELRDVHVIDADDPDLGFVGTLPSGNLLEIKSAISSGAVQAPPEVQSKTHRPLRVSFDAFMSTSLETMKGTIGVAERQLQHLVHEHLSQEKQAWRDARIAFMRDVEQEVDELLERVVSSDTFKQHDGSIITDDANPIVIFAYGYDDEDELEIFMRLLEVEFTRHLKGLDHLKKFFQLDRHGRGYRCFVMLDADTAELENQLHNSFMSRTHEELRKKIIARVQRVNHRLGVEKGLHEDINKRVETAQWKLDARARQLVAEVDGDLVESIRTRVDTKTNTTIFQITIFLNTTDQDEAMLFTRLLKPIVERELKPSLFNPFGIDRPKMGLGITIHVPFSSLTEAYGDNNSRQLQFAKLYRELMRLKQEDGLPYLRAFPYQQCFVLGLDRDADEDEKQLVLKLVTNMAAKALSIGHTVKMSSWDNGPAVAVYPANYVGLSKDIKQAVTSVVTEADLQETFSNAEPAFKTPAQIALDKESKRKVIAFETAIRHEILWINVALRSIDPPAGLFEFDRGFHLEPKGIKFTLNCRHPVQEEHELWLKLAKRALEKPRDEGVVVTIESSHGNEEQWVADWAKWPEVDTPDWVHHICITINDEELHEVCSWMTNQFRSDFVLREFDPRWREDSFDDHAQDLTEV